MIKIKRIYEPFSPADGYRILVDRLWPRGVKKENAHVDEWMKEVAPSTTLRKWFNHEPDKWVVFVSRYQKELKKTAPFRELVARTKANKTVTLLYGAKNETYNQAVVLRELLTTT